MTVAGFGLERLVAGDFLVRAQDGDDTLVIRLELSSDVLSELGPRGSDRERVADLTMRFLLERQVPGDLPPTVSLEDVAAAYDTFVETLRTHLYA